MLMGIYLVIIILFVVLTLWTSNNLKRINEIQKKIKFIIGGFFVLFIVTFIIFTISKIGLNYPNKEILWQVKKITILLFLPINGFISMPHIATLMLDIKEDNVEENILKKRLKSLLLIMLIAVIFEIFYLKNFQNGIIQMLER